MALQKVKDSNLPASRLHNWNLVAAFLQQVEFPLDSEVKNLIIAGDDQAVSQLLRELQTHSGYSSRTEGRLLSSRRAAKQQKS